MSLQSIFAILSFTSILVLLTLGLGVIAGMMRIFNLAHGEFVLLGAATVYVASVAGAPVWVGILLAPVVLAVFGAIVERTIVARLYGRPLSAILATWALALIIRGVVLQLLGQTTRSVPYPIRGSVSVFGASIATWRLIIVMTTVVVAVLFLIALYHSSLGLKARAVLENAELATVSGLPIRRLYTGVFALGSALAGLAGAMIVPLSSLYSELGVTYLVRSFLALMVGGIGTFEGAVAGAGIVGGMESASSFYIEPVASGILAFGVSVLIMRFRPQGIRGRTT